VRKNGFFSLELAPAGHAGPPTRPDRPFARLLAALRLRPRRALSSAEARQASCQDLQAATETLNKGPLFQLCSHHDTKSHDIQLLVSLQAFLLFIIFPEAAGSPRAADSAITKESVRERKRPNAKSQRAS
jgi:hypothetical protein